MSEDNPIQVPKLSTGDDSTLGNYRRLAVSVFGEDSGAVRFLDSQIAESPNGKDEVVIAAEGQMIMLLANRNGYPRLSPQDTDESDIKVE